MTKIRRRFVFYGCVQGVGFRWKACHTANHYGITGWVRNLENGAVELEAEGIREDLDALIRILGSHAWGYTDRVDMEDIPVEGDRTFEIRQ